VKKVKREYEAFLDGYKPAIVLESYSRYLHLVKDYPNYCYKEMFMYFFQTDEQRKKFIKEINEVKGDSYKWI